MPRIAKAAAAAPPKSLDGDVLIVDNGGYTIKAGLATERPDPDQPEQPDQRCRLIPNCIAQGRDKHTWVGAQLDRCRDYGEMVFRRPVERGALVNWEAEKEIWEQTFVDADAVVKCDPHETNLILTEGLNTPQALQNNCDQMIFEYFEFQSCYRCLGPSLSAYNDIQHLFGAPRRMWGAAPAPAQSMLVIDSGYSHTTVTPFIRGRPVQSAIRRLDIGGKFMTNYLKELVSMRHYNMMDETYLMNEVKESVCFVTSDLSRDLDRTWKGRMGEHRTTMTAGHDPIVIDYVLPDYNATTTGTTTTHHHQHGYTRPHDPTRSSKLRNRLAAGAHQPSLEEYMTLGNERFTVPELLFRPGDVGLRQAGLPETVMQSLHALPQGLWAPMLGHIVVVGGNARIRGLIPRLESELQQLTSSDFLLRVAAPADPVTYNWLGGALLATNKPLLATLSVTRQDYLEHGSHWTARKFAAGANEFAW